MGTRHFIGFLYPEENGEVLLRGSYNQYDGYPTGTGRTIQGELPEVLKLENLLDRVRKMRWVDQTDDPSAEDLAEVVKLGTWDHEVSTGEDWYACLRGDHGSMLKRLQHGIATASHNFPEDSLFCEWSYILDLTGPEPAMIVLEGFNTDFDNQWEHCRLESDPKWTPRYGGSEQYAGSKLLWQGSVEDYIALDMETLEATEEEEA